MQLERVGSDFHGGELSVERDEVARLGRSCEAAENAAGGALAYAAASGEEANLIVEVELSCRKHLYSDSATLTADTSLETGSLLR